MSNTLHAKQHLSSFTKRFTVVHASYLHIMYVNLYPDCFSMWEEKKIKVDNNGGTNMYSREGLTCRKLTLVHVLRFTESFFPPLSVSLLPSLFPSLYGFYQMSAF